MYKRQGRDLAGVLLDDVAQVDHGGRGLLCDPDGLLREEDGPVSYTHLDVYKRQALLGEEVLLLVFDLLRILEGRLGLSVGVALSLIHI